MPFDIQAKEINLRASNRQENGIKRKTLNSNQIRIYAFHAGFLQRFYGTLDMAVARIYCFRLERYLYY